MERKEIMNKLFKILVFILAVEIILGYGIYFKDSSLVSGHYVSSTLRLVNIGKNLIDLSKARELLNKNKLRELKETKCKKFEEKNQIITISGFNSYRRPIKFQTDLNFLNTFDQKKDFLILIVGNSETFGWHQKDNHRLHSMLQKN